MTNINPFERFNRDWALVTAGIVPILGMLMLPKTVCYILMIIAFLKAVKVRLFKCIRMCYYLS